MSDEELGHSLVDIRLLVPHPQNPNRMPPELFAKLRNNIRETGKYPALIVRKLGDKRQILDGEHRWKILKELGHKTIWVDYWGDLSDDDAFRLLTTFNRLRGRDDKQKRATLLSLLRQSYQADELSRFLPETAEQIEHKIEKIDAEVVTLDAEEASADFDSYVLMVDTELEPVINAAIRLKMHQGGLIGKNLDQNEFMTIFHSYQRARAIASICADFLIKNTQ